MMAAHRAYLDHNASAPLLPEARAALLDALCLPANPSSVHAQGRAAKHVLEQARRHVADLVGGRPEHVVFTSGASEAAATLLSPDWTMGRAPLAFSRLFVAASDHPCLLKGGRFPADRVSAIGVGEDGLIDLEALEAQLAAHDRTCGPALVATHMVNNETGIIQNVAEIGRLARAAGAVTILDAVQAAGRISIDISDGYADYLILSSHKIGGPKGAGAIIAAADLMMPRPLIAGGGQEKGHRAGTESLPAIAGFGAAALVARENLGRMAAVQALRDGIERTLLELVPDAVVYGRRAPRVANTSFFSIPGMKAETAQIAFDLAGVALSAGSACSSGRIGPSHVLEAMGFGADSSALRVSVGPSTSKEEIAIFTSALSDIARRRRSAEAAA